jgi:hypothetical protein
LFEKAIKASLIELILGDSDMASVADLSINQSLKKENEEVKTEEELLEYMVDVPEEIETVRWLNLYRLIVFF